VLVLNAGQKYVTVRAARRRFVIDESLTELEQRQGDGFLRIHRNAHVARHPIHAFARQGRDEDDPGSDGWSVRVAPFDEWFAVSLSSNVPAPPPSAFGCSRSARPSCATPGACWWCWPVTTRCATCSQPPPRGLQRSAQSNASSAWPAR
jgi:hypothetical protein